MSRSREREKRPRAPEKSVQMSPPKNIWYIFNVNSKIYIPGTWCIILYQVYYTTVDVNVKTVMYRYLYPNALHIVVHMTGSTRYEYSHALQILHEIIFASYLV